MRYALLLSHLCLPFFLVPSTSDAPPETREVGTQVQPERQIILDTSMERYDGYCLMAVPNLEAFIRLLTAHSAFASTMI